MRPGTSEQALLNSVKSGDHEAMKELYGLYSPYLHAVCSRYVTDEGAAEDVLQESFIKIFTSIDQFSWRGEGSLRAWMSKIVVNESLKHLRGRASAAVPEFLDEAVAEDIPDEDPDIADIPAEVVQKLIRRLPDGYRAVFNLYVFEDKSHKEIARLLGIKENSSTSQLHRAKALLVKWINEYRGS